jgi:hypothetical protein
VVGILVVHDGVGGVLWPGLSLVLSSRGFYEEVVDLVEIRVHRLADLVGQWV